MAVSEQGSWDDFVADLSRLAVRFDAETYLYDDLVVMSSRSHLPGHKVGSIRISRVDDEAARVEAGWSLDMFVDYIAEDTSRSVPALGLVEAICSGNAAEHCLIDGEGRWVGVLLEAWDQEGRRWQAGCLDSQETRATRRFPSWLGPVAEATGNPE